MSSLDWKRRTNGSDSWHEGVTVNGRYAARVRRDLATGWWIAEYKVGAGGDAYAQVEGDFKTAKAAKECAARRYYLAQEDAARAEREAGYPATIAAAQKDGADHFAYVATLGRESVAAQSLRRDVRNGETAYRAAKAHCGVFAPSAQHRVYGKAWREAYYAAMEVWTFNRAVNRHADSVTSGEVAQHVAEERIALDWGANDYAQRLIAALRAELLQRRLAAECAKVSAELAREARDPASVQRNTDLRATARSLSYTGLATWVADQRRFRAMYGNSMCGATMHALLVIAVGKAEAIRRRVR